MKLDPTKRYISFRFSYNGTKARTTHGKVNVDTQKYPDKTKYVSDVRKENTPLFDNNDHAGTIRTKSDACMFGHLACVVCTLIPLNSSNKHKQDTVIAMKRALLAQVDAKQKIMSDYTAPTDFSAVDALVALF